MEEIIKKLDELYFENYKEKFNKKPNEKRLTIYEKAFGFTEETRIGSKQFCCYLGYFMEDVYNLSSKFNKINKENFDGYNDECYFECKNRHDTMKQSMALREIKPKLKKAILENKNFFLLILVDKNNNSRNIPIDKGYGLSKIKNLRGYNKDKHRWISGDEIFKYLFDENAIEIKEKILNLLTR